MSTQQVMELAGRICVMLNANPDSWQEDIANLITKYHAPEGLRKAAQALFDDLGERTHPETGMRKASFTHYVIQTIGLWDELRAALSSTPSDEQGDYGPSSRKCDKCGQRHDVDEYHTCPTNAMQKVREALDKQIGEVLGSFHDHCMALAYDEANPNHICPDTSKLNVIPQMVHEALSLLPQCGAGEDKDSERLNHLERYRYSHKRSRSYEFSILQMIPEGHMPLREAIDADIQDKASAQGGVK